MFNFDKKITIPMLKRVVKTTGDGSQTLYLPEWEEHYHSVYGAFGESRHVFIQQGLERVTKRLSKIRILEVGFGTGLNALLSLDFALKNGIHLSYCALEPFPLSDEEVAKLSHPDKLPGEDYRHAFHRMHQMQSGQEELITPYFAFVNWHHRLEDAILDSDCYDLVYHDAFAPQFQPGLWDETAFGKLFKAMRKGGLLTTYSACGSVKRALRACGFSLEHPPGPTGKREITVAIKQ